MPDRPDAAFQTTRWQQVVAARGGTPAAQAALRDLCETYYAPVELFVRRYREGADDARDLTHEFFARILEGKSLTNADQTRGRFRSYLLGAVKHCLADYADRHQALKRGRGQTLHSLDQPNFEKNSGADQAAVIADPRAVLSDAYFDRQWALAVVEHAIATLRHEAELNAELSRFEVLQRWLVAPTSQNAAIEAARSLNLSDGAVKVAVHRLQKRFRQVVVEHIASTVNDPAEIPDELDELIRAMNFSTG
ncbi:MAG: sigma-70 family RNA polymerase sigma factor [Planctomycetes bacterium]|nr:sigma-70 family RNA polymerase sigma factor [Planctomycetota bacterium]